MILYCSQCVLYSVPLHLNNAIGATITISQESYTVMESAEVLEVCVTLLNDTERDVEALGLTIEGTAQGYDLTRLYAHTHTHLHTKSHTIIYYKWQKFHKND